MYLKILVVCLLLTPAGTMLAQESEFCEAINAVIRDAPNRFRNIKGKELEQGPNVVMWESGIKPAGSIGARFVLSMGLFFEGAFFQTRNKAEMMPQYEHYGRMLSDCLTPQGYKLTRQENFYPGMKEFRKLVFMREPTSDTKLANLPAHVAMEVTFSKDIGKYTLVVFVFEH